MLGDKSYSGFDAMVLPEFAKEEEGRVWIKKRAFQWHLEVRRNWRIQEWRMVTGNFQRRQKTAKSVWYAWCASSAKALKCVIDWLLTFTFLFFYKLKSQKCDWEEACKLMQVNHRFPLISCLSMQNCFYNAHVHLRNIFCYLRCN